MHSYGGNYGSGDQDYDFFGGSRRKYSAASGGGGGGSGALLNTTSEVAIGTEYPYTFAHGVYDDFANDINVGAYTAFGSIKLLKGSKGSNGRCSGYDGFGGTGGEPGTVSGSMEGWKAVVVGATGSNGNSESFGSGSATAYGASGGTGGGSYGDTYGKGGSSYTINTHSIYSDLVEPGGPAIIIWFKGT